MARNLMDILTDCKAERERLTHLAVCGICGLHGTDMTHKLICKDDHEREPEEFEREASAHCEDREATDSIGE